MAGLYKSVQISLLIFTDSDDKQYVIIITIFSIIIRNILTVRLKIVQLSNLFYQIEFSFAIFVLISREMENYLAITKNCFLTEAFQNLRHNKQKTFSIFSSSFSDQVVRLSILCQIVPGSKGKIEPGTKCIVSC